MNVFPLRPLAVSLVATTALAQSNPVAYPQNGVDGNSGHTAPIGVQYVTTNSDESRWQQQIPERFLPNTACLISGLQLVVMTSSTNRTIPYTLMQVTMSVAPANATLSTTFANNLTSPQVVFSLTNQSLTWNPNQWNTVTFQQPFAYPGTGDLVIDLRKVVDRNLVTSQFVNPMTISYPSRPDLPQAISTWGPPSSGAATATVATSTDNPLRLRLLCGNVATLGLDSNSNRFRIGQSFDATLLSTSGHLYAGVVSLGWSPAPVSVPGVAGRIFVDVTSAVTYALAVVGTAGIETTTIPVPNVPGLAGMRITWQAVTQAGSNLPLLTNATDNIIQP